MNTTTKLTAAEFIAIQTILANGGKVESSNGRKQAGRINAGLLNSMQERGLVRLWGRGADGYLRAGRNRVNVEVCAAACVAFNAEQNRRLARSL